MKLADLTTAALKDNPNLELEVDVTDEQGKTETVSIVFRNLVLVSEEERRNFRGVDKEIDKITKGKGDDSAIRRLADSAKYMLGMVVADKSHIDLLEEKFSEVPQHRDALWNRLLTSYHEETQAGEA